MYLMFSTKKTTNYYIIKGTGLIISYTYLYLYLRSYFDQIKFFLHRNIQKKHSLYQLMYQVNITIKISTKLFLHFVRCDDYTNTFGCISDVFAHIIIYSLLFLFPVQEPNTYILYSISIFFGVKTRLISYYTYNF